MQIVNRVRNNWPLLVALVVLVASLALLQGMPYKFARVIPFDMDHNVNYPNLLAQYGGVPITKFLILIPLAIIAWVGARKTSKSYKSLPAILLLVTSIFVCGSCTYDFWRGGDKTRLLHLQTFRHNNKIYHLSRALNLNDSGGWTENFLVFRCEIDETYCSYVKQKGDSVNRIVDDDFNPPTVLLTYPATNALYLQIGSEKTLIVE